LEVKHELSGPHTFEGPEGPPGPPGPPGVDGESAYGYGGMFVETSEGSCFTANPHTYDCNCPDGYLSMLMLITEGTEWDDGYRYLYICY